MGQIAILNSLGRISGGSGDDMVTLTIDTRGTGADVATFKLEVYSETDVFLDGNARFYDDVGGTLNPTTTRKILPGSVQNLYIKSNSGLSQFIFPQANKVYKLGWSGDKDNSWLGWYFAWSSTTANSPVLGGTPNFKNSETLFIGSSGSTIGIDVNMLKYFRNLKQLSINGNQTHPVPKPYIYGDVKNLPRSLDYIDAWTGCKLTGNIKDLPRTMMYLALEGENALTGWIGDIPYVTTGWYAIQGQNTLYGKITDLKVNQWGAWIGGYNTMTGDLGDINPRYVDIWFSGNTNLTYRKRRLWTINNMSQVSLNPINPGFDVTEMDNLLIDLADATWNQYSYVYMYGAMPSPTAASATARALLTSKGVDTYYV